MTANELCIRMLEDYGDEFSIEDFIDATALMVLRNKERYVEICATAGEVPYGDILACLDGAIDHLHDASFAVYASFK